MELHELKKIINALPSSYDHFKLVSLADMQAQANGFTCVNIPINHIGLDLDRSEVLVLDDKQASICKVVGKVNVAPVP